MLTAGEFCKRDVVTALGYERVAAVAERMRDRRVGTVVVVEERAEGPVPVGVLTDRDMVAGLVALEPSYVDRALIRDLPSSRLASAREEEDLYEVSLCMRSHGVQRVSIVNRAGVLQGVIAFDDLLGHLAQEIGRLAELLERQQENERRLRASVEQTWPGTSAARETRAQRRHTQG